jgi:hypothetical protein
MVERKDRSPNSAANTRAKVCVEVVHIWTERRKGFGAWVRMGDRK